MTSSDKPISGTSRRALLAMTAIPALGTLLPAGAAFAADTPASSDLPDFAPIPPFAKGPAIGPEGYYVAPIRRNLYWVTDAAGYVAAFLTTRDGVVLFDAPPSMGGNLQRAIDSVTLPSGRPNRVTHLVYSHFHVDHIGASGLFGKDVVRIGHTETRRVLRGLKDPRRPVPDVVFDDRYVLRVGGERVDLAYHGPNHTIDSIFVHFPHHRALMLVDVVIPSWVPFAALNVSQDILGLVGVPATALDYSFDTFIAGHVKLGSRREVSLHQQYMDDLTASAQHAIDTVDRTPFAQRYPGNQWAVTKTYFDALVAATAAPVVAKYTGVLAGADVYTDSNAFVLIESLRLESGYGLSVHP
ncbi:MBL fold metallo-hydrolase [Paractinoplanes toevensis]|uniref:MBL fold metallo-hydrolase n=1 Tax=Paractinoplanes toevensis TaxID=571911 RepID=A0A919TEM0_9ACTN|nr:MBL fold metallo-hydrolase [Actinoplanes toevensis]GIM92995.1 MBL fold metallo-hydrolase [Actinoplanes toevensis]